MKKVKANLCKIDDSIFEKLNKVLIANGIEDFEIKGLKVKPQNLSAENTCKPGKEKFCWIDKDTKKCRCKCI